MLETQVAFYLNKYLGDYLTGLDPQSLKISVLAGDVTLSNLLLKPDALNKLNLPITVTAGLLGSLKLKVGSWAQLGRVPVVIEMDKLYILTRPRSDADTVREPTEQEKATEFEAMQKRLEEGVRAWMAKAQAKATAAAAEQGGYLKGFIDVIIGNLQLAITNIHLRYEDDVSNPGHKFALGITLQRISAHTVDEGGQPTYVTHNPLELLRKGVQLQGFGSYFDVEAHMLGPHNDWPTLLPSQWDYLFNPAQMAELTPYIFVLRPVGGSATYLRRGRNARKGNSDAVHEAGAQLQDVTLHISRPQYVNVQKLLEAFSAYKARAPFLHLRPSGRPAGRDGARAWWQYTYRAVLKQTQAVTMSWQHLREMVALRREYVPLYEQCLAAGQVGGNEKTRELDRALPEGTALLFRQMAATKYEQARRAARSTANGKGDGGRDRVAAPAQRTWWGWMTGQQPAPGQAGRDVDSEVLSQSGLMSEEEANQLMQVVKEQEQAVEQDDAHPWSVRMRLSVDVGFAGIQLDDAHGSEILRSGVHAARAALTMYPVTTSVEVDVDNFVLSGAESKQLLRTGSAAGVSVPLASVVEELQAAGTEQRAGGAEAPRKAMRASYTQSPQQGSADAEVTVSLAPSYVTYDAPCMERLVAFFKVEQAMNLTALEAKTVARVERARRAATATLSAALRERPSLLVCMELDAPKVALPVAGGDGGQGEVTLVLDFGHFVLRSDPDAAQQLPDDEAALYECFSLRLSDVSAYLVDGQFTWGATAAKEGSGGGGAGGSQSFMSAESSADMDDEISRSGSGPGLQSSTRSGLVVPLLGQCGMDVRLHLARAPSRRLPPLRVFGEMPRFVFYVSAARLKRVLRVVKAALPASGEPVQQPGSNSWLAQADYSGTVKRLSYRGIPATPVWTREFAVLLRGRLWFFPAKGFTELIVAYNVWSKRRITRPPMESCDGKPHCIAVLPEGSDMSKPLEDPHTVIIRLPNDDAATMWHQKLVQSQRIMLELAGSEGISSDLAIAPDGSTASVVGAGSEADRSESVTPGGGGSSRGGVLPSVVVDARLGELVVYVSGRTTDIWWPPSDEEEGSFEGVRDGGSSSARGTSGASLRRPMQRVINVDGERSLVALKTTAGHMAAELGSDHMGVTVEVGNFEIEDLLVGERNMVYRHLARSIAPAEDGQELGKDLFFEADELLTNAACTALPAADLKGAREAVMSISFQRWSDTSPVYENVDTQLGIKVTALYFYCNRPTVAALMGIGPDVSAATAAALPPASSGGDAASGSDTAVADDVHDSGWGSDGEGDEELSMVSGGAGSGTRVTFRLQVEMRKLEVALNYEEDELQIRTCALASVEDFGVHLDVYARSLRISARLGNARVSDASLGPDSLYYNAVDVKRSGAKSLIELEFASHSEAESWQEGRVPSGAPYYTLQGHMSQLDVVFLNRFLMEMLSYLRVLLAMQPTPLASEPAPAPASGGGSGNKEAGGGDSFSTARSDSVSQAQSSTGRPLFEPTTDMLQRSMTSTEAERIAQYNVPRDARDARPAPPNALAQQKKPAAPFLLVMDLSLEAPLITVPRNSDSEDNLELDLGSLHLSNTVALVSGGSPLEPSAIIQDSSTIYMGGMRFYVVKNGVPGKNIIQQYDAGTSLFFKRPVQDVARTLPGFELHVRMPAICAAVDDEEYRMITTAAAENVAESTRLPRGAALLEAMYMPAQEGEGGEGGGASGEGASRARRSLDMAAIQEETPQRQSSSGEATADGGGEAGGAVAVRVVVDIGKAQLELQTYSAASDRVEPLAAFTIADLWVAYTSKAAGQMAVSLSIPRVDAEDLRKGVPQQQRRVISSGDAGVSFLTLQYDANTTVGKHALDVRLQRPTFVAELNFMLGVTRFVVPSLPLAGAQPVPYASYDLSLKDPVFTASEDLYLAPESRLLADAPGGCNEYVYDAAGHRLVLPPESITQEPLPLIIVGTSKTLHLRNVRVVNAAALPACVQLAQGAQLDMSPEAGCVLLDGEDPLQEQGGGARARRSFSSDGASPRASYGRSSSMSGTPMRIRSSLHGSRNTALGGERLQQPPPPPTFTDIRIAAVGVALQFVEPQPVDGGGGGMSTTGSSSTLGGRAGSVAGSEQRGSSTSLKSLDMPSTAAAAACAHAPTAATATAAPPPSVRSLACYMDLTASYSGSINVPTPTSKVSLALQGLRVETQAFALPAPDAGKGGGAASVVEDAKLSLDCTQGVVLEPCRITADVVLVGSRTDVSGEASDVLIRISPDIVDMMVGIHKTLLPLMHPPPDRPLQRCAYFELLWSSEAAAAAAEREGIAPVASACVTGLERGVTFWRAQVQPGYVPLGDCATAGEGQPTFSVVAVAVNSGLVAYPIKYNMVWTNGDVAVWQPVPPPLHVSVGHFVTRGVEPPPLTAAGCLHQHVVVESTLGQVLTFQAQGADTSLATAVVVAARGVVVQCVDNSLATFFVRTSAADALEGPAMDIRTPLGVPPAALPATLAAQARQFAEAEPSNREAMSASSRGQLHQDFSTLRRNLLQREETLLPTSVNFARVWWNKTLVKQAVGGGKGGFSIWRPIAPAGYFALGDCLMQGFNPPASVTVVRDSEAMNNSRGQPLLKQPTNFTHVWQDENMSSTKRLVLWQPVPPAGYVAMGVVATIGDRPPDVGIMMCVRVDAATSIDRQALGSALWRQPQLRQRPGMAAWVADDRLHTFVVGAAGRPVMDAWQLKLLDEQEAEGSTQPGSASGPSLAVTFRNESTSVLLCDSLRSPVLELDTTAISLAIGSSAPQVYSASMGARIGVWSYNSAIRSWEPVVEPWNNIIHVEANLTQKVVDGIKPGMAMSVKSTTETIFCDLTHAWLTSSLAAFMEWQGLQRASSAARLAGAASHSSVVTVVNNLLGREAIMKMHFGDAIREATLPPGQPIKVIQPLAPPPLRHSQAKASASSTQQAKVLLVEVEAVAAQDSQGAASNQEGVGKRAGVSPELCVYLQLQEGSSEVGTGSFGLRTRGMVAGRDGCAAFGERLLLELPSVQPPPESPRQRARRPPPLALVAQLWDLAASGGRGELLATGSTSLPPLTELRVDKQETLSMSLSQPGGKGPRGYVLHGSYLLQAQDVATGMRLTDAWARDHKTEDSMGARALLIQGEHAAGGADRWAAVPSMAAAKVAAAKQSGRAKAAAALGLSGGLGGGAVPIADYEVLLESCTRDGIKHETLRSNALFVNNTELSLQVAVVQRAGTPLPSPGSMASGLSASSDEAVGSSVQRSGGSLELEEEAVWENERYIPIKGWSPRALLPTDPDRYSWGRRLSETDDAFPALPLPNGWEWDGPWSVWKGSPYCDEGGWWYASDWSALGSVPGPSNTKTGVKYLRRRKYVRPRRHGGGMSHSSSNSKPADSTNELVHRTVLGVVAPGNSLPLPYNWRQASKQLQVRPLLGGAEEAVHGWSVGASGGSSSLKLDAVCNGLTRMVACPPLNQGGNGGNASASAHDAALASATVWLSLVVEGERFPPMQGGDQHVTDWQLLASSPIMLDNQLPVPASYSIWERNKGAGGLLKRQTGIIAAGETLPVYTADLRQTLGFTLEPEGYQWTQRAPILLTRGYATASQAGVGNEVQLPDMFSVRRPGASAAALDVYVDRDLATGPWLKSTQGIADFGAAAASGIPLTATFFTPLWLVNATHLAITSTVVPYSLRSRESGSNSAGAASGSAEQLASDGGIDTRLRIITTHGGLQDRDPPGAQTSGPNSTEMLTFPRLGLAPARSGEQASSSRGEAAAGQARLHGVRLRVGGSGWTPPLAVDASSELPAEGSGAVHDASVPLVVRAVVPEVQFLAEVMVRVEAAGGRFARTQVLRVEPFMLVSNRTGMSLQLLQCRVRGVQQLQQRPTGVGGATRLSKRSSSLVRMRTDSFVKALVRGDAGMADSSSLAWQALPAVLPALEGAVVTAGAKDSPICEVSKVDVPAGMMGMPLDWSSRCGEERAMCFRASSMQAGAASDKWSRPVVLHYPATATHHVAVPVLGTQAELPSASSADSEDQESNGAASASRAGSTGHLVDDSSTRAGHLVAHTSSIGQTLAEAQQITTSILPPSSGGQQLAVLRVSCSMRWAGALHMVFETLAADPPYLLENRTPYALQFRQAGIMPDPWAVLPPFSATGYVWPHASPSGALPQLEVMDASGKAPPRQYALDTPGAAFGSDGGAGAGSITALRVDRLPVAGGGLCSVEVADVEQHITLRAGLAGVAGGGGVLGRGGADRVLRVLPGLRRMGDAALRNGRGEQQGGLANLELNLQLGAVEISVVDHHPRELAALTVGGLRCEYSVGTSPDGSYTRLGLELESLQLDDMGYETRCPVVLIPVQDRTVQVGEDTNMFSFMLVRQQRSSRRRVYYPYISAGVNKTLQLAVSEALIWDFMDMYKRLGLEDLSRTARDTGSDRVTTAASDVPIAITLLSIGDVNALVTFRADPLTRPRWASGVMSVGLNVANFTCAPVALHGMERENVAMLRSVFVSQVTRVISSQLYSVAFSLVRNFGIVGGIAKITSIMSSGLASLADDKYKHERLMLQRKRSIRSAGDGLQAGAETLAKGMFRGFTGVLTKPMQGMRQGGVQGLVKGMGAGMMGLAAKPGSALLDAVSVAMEGIDVSTDKLIGGRGSKALVTTRNRLPRAVGGDRKLLPWLRDDDGEESRLEALGAALLALSMAEQRALAEVEQTQTHGRYDEHAYEDAVLLDDDRVVVMSSRAMMLLKVPGYGALKEAALQGSLSWMEVGPAEKLIWMVMWDDVLHLELGYASPNERFSSRLIVHRKARRRAGQVPDEDLAHVVKCTSSWPQAEQLKAIALKILYKYYTAPRSNAALQWLHRDTAQRTPVEQLPEQMLAMEYVLRWRTSRTQGDRSGQVVSFWAPVPPSANYYALGDVACVGTQPPSQPVSVFRDDSALLEVQQQQQQRGERPLFVPPSEYHLIWRDNGANPVTMWMPKAPPGYVALGCIVSSEIEYPSDKGVLCVREDATARTHLAEAPVWKYEPRLFLLEAAIPGSDPETMRALNRWNENNPESWKCSVWPVDNAQRTFLVTRSLSKPGAEYAQKLAGS